MAITLHFDPGVGPDTYDAVRNRLDEEGAWPPEGIRYHVCLKRQDGNIEVLEVWDSQEAAQRFGEKLRPIIEEQGVQVQPTAAEVHREERF